MMAKTNAFVLLLLICSSYCSQRSSISGVLLSQLQARSDDVIDDGLYFLQVLKSRAQNELARAENQDVQGQANIQSQITEFERFLKENEVHCDKVDASISQEITENEPDFDWVQGRIQEDQQRIEKLNGIKCSSDESWLNFIKSGSQVLKAIQFLKISVESYKSFAQIKTIIPALELLQNESVLNIDTFLAQLKEDAPTEEEELPSDASILSDWQTTTQVKNINKVKTELLELLDNMERSIQAKQSASSTNKIISSLRVTEFIEQLEREIAYLQELSQRLSGTAGDQNDQGVEDCGDNQKQIDQLSQLRQHLVDLKDYDNVTQTHISSQIELIQQIIDQYTQGILNIARQYEISFEDTQEENIEVIVQVQGRQRLLTQNYADKVVYFEEYINSIVQQEYQLA